ncbi:MAG TPA: carboxypeptidase-like regulatory domain-containing protein [Bacteroidia bacterium]|nr:carboxypeptidase-like regulatory domain-containing protein [Bacteroidia bacterium]
MSHYSDKSKALIIGLLLIVNFSVAQLSSLHDQQLWIKADDTFEFGDYMNALKIYEQLNDIDSTNDEINFKIGVCNFNIRKFRKKAPAYFNKVNSDHFPETNYYLGRLCLLNREYDDAIRYFTAYKNSKHAVEHTPKEIQDLIHKAQTAIVFEKNKNDSIKIVNLGDSINTAYAEYAPLISEKEDFMLFTSRRKNEAHTKKDPLGEYFEDIYISRKKDGKWGSASLLTDTLINTPLHDASTGLSADGKKLLIYRTSPDLTSGDIYESNYDGNSFSTPSIIPTNVNSKKYRETSACYSPDNNIIFFSSDRPGGFGGKDLYYMKRLSNGKWGSPFNLGPTINTEYDEDAPFVHPLNNTLFFSSQGHLNMGGYDIFKSNFDEAGKFTQPENLGCPINTSDDDLFFVLNANGSTGYFSSEREDGFGSQDIYKVVFSPPLLLNVYHALITNESGNAIPKAEFTLTDSSTAKTFGIYQSNSVTGKLLIISEPKQYQLQIKAPGYETYTVTIKLGAETDLVYKLKEQVK